MAGGGLTLFLIFSLLQDRNKMFVWDGAGLIVSHLSKLQLATEGSLSLNKDVKGSIGGDLVPELLFEDHATSVTSQLYTSCF